MSDARIQRVNGYSDAGSRLMSKHCTSDSAVVGRKAEHYASNTSADHTASTVRVSGRKTRCVSDSNNILPHQTGHGGKARDQGSITEDILSPRTLPDKAEELGPVISEMLVKNAATKAISFQASPKKSTLRAIKAKKPAADKKPGKGKEVVVTRIGRPRWQASRSGKPKSTKDTLKTVKVYKSSVYNKSDSSKPPEPIRATAHTSQPGVTPLHQSKKRISVTSQAGYRTRSQEKVTTTLATKQKTYFPLISPSRVVKTQSSQNCYFISFSVSPRKVFCKSSELVTAIPRLEDAVHWVSLPHRCAGYENLFHVDGKIKSDGSLIKRRALFKRKSKCKTKGTVKTQDSEDVAIYPSLSKHCPDKCNKAGSMNEGEVVDAGQLREAQPAASKTSIRNIPCDTHSIHKIFQKSSLVFLSADKPSKKTQKDAKRVTEKSKRKLFTRNMIDGNKHVSDFKHVIYRQKLPTFNHHSRIRPKSCVFAQPSPHSTAQRHDPDVVRNSITKGIPHSAVAKTPLPSEKVTTGPCVRVKIVHKKAKSGTTGSHTQKKVKHRDKSEMTVTKADTKKASKDSPSAVHINILKIRPHTTIGHYRNKAKGERNADSCFPYDMKLPHSKVCKHIPKMANSEMAVSSVKKAFGKKNSWDSHENTQKSLSSFFRQVSSCDSSTQKQMALLQRTFRLPAGAVSCSEHKFRIYHEQSLRKHSKVCIPKISSHSSIQRSSSSCCMVTFLPPLFSFLNSTNKTLPLPVFMRSSSESSLAYPKNIRETQPLIYTTRRLVVTSDDKLSGTESSISQKENNKSIKHETDDVQTCVGAELKEGVENVLVSDNNTADIPSELKKTRQVSRRGTNLTSFQISKRRAAQKLTPKQITTPFSVSPKYAAKSILRMGHIFTTQATKQCGRNTSLQPPPKQNQLQTQYSNRSRGETEIKHTGPATADKKQTHCKLLIFCALCFTAIVQVILYYFMPRR